MRGQGKRKKIGVVLMLAPEEILPNPNQPRRHFDPKELQALADSISENGVLQPLTVRALEGGCYELIAGERRLRASQMAGLEVVPCLTADISRERSAIFALVENLQRQDLGFFEEAEGIAQLMVTCELTQEQAARALGLAPSTLSNKLRLLKLAPSLRAQIDSAGLTERHARALLRLESEETRQRVLTTIIERQLNVQDTDRLIEALCTAAPKPSKRPAITLVRDVRLFVNTIHHAVDAMRSSGIAAVAEKTETEEDLVYTVRIPKGSALMQQRTRQLREKVG